MKPEKTMFGIYLYTGYFTFPFSWLCMSFWLVVCYDVLREVNLYTDVCLCGWCVINGLQAMAAL